MTVNPFFVLLLVQFSTVVSPSCPTVTDLLKFALISSASHVAKNWFVYS